MVSLDCNTSYIKDYSRSNMVVVHSCTSRLYSSVTKSTKFERSRVKHDVWKWERNWGVSGKKPIWRKGNWIELVFYGLGIVWSIGWILNHSRPFHAHSTYLWLPIPPLCFYFIFPPSISFFYLKNFSKF